MADGVADGRAHSQLYLNALIADGARQARVQGALPVGVGVVQTLLTQRVVVVLAVRQHALARRAHRTGLAAARQLAEEEAVVADTDGVVGVGARRLHPHQASALGAGLTYLRVAVVL